MAVLPAEALMSSLPHSPVKTEIAHDRRVPAEWEPQECVWLAWPHNQATWPARFDMIPAFYAKWVKLIAELLPVRVLASTSVANQCASMLGSHPNIELVDIATNDCWIRDYGPTFVLSEADTRLSVVDWQYNAWGGKSPPWDLDAAVCKQVSEVLNLTIAATELVVEGGALEFDGRGRLLTTSDCLLADNRNPGLSETKVAQELHRLTGVTEIVWLDGGGLEGDDTDGHVDQLARFVDPENIVACVSNHPNDKHNRGLKDNFLQLQAWAETTTPKPEIHQLPIPKIRRINGQPIPQSYCNFLRIGPDFCLVPQFSAPEDDYAISLLSELTGCQVTPIDCTDLVWGLGALHCASRDQPKMQAGATT